MNHSCCVRIVEGCEGKLSEASVGVKVGKGIQRRLQSASSNAWESFIEKLTIQDRKHPYQQAVNLHNEL